MGFFDGYVQGTKQRQLEEERTKTLKNLDLKNEASQLQNEGTSQINIARGMKNEETRKAISFQDEKRNSQQESIEAQREAILKKEEEVKAVQRKNAVQNVDNAITTALKGDLDPIKEMLMNGTDTNPNTDVKAMIERELGGVVVDVRVPDTKLLGEGEEYHPDQVEVEVIKTSGEKVIDHLSLGQLGGAMGTPHRIGVDKFSELTEGKLRVLKAKENSLRFNGTTDYKGFAMELMSLAADGNKEAESLLGRLDLAGAKDGDTVLSALTAQWMKEEDPTKKAEIMKNIKSAKKLLGTMGGGKEKTLTPIQKLQEQYINETDPEKLKSIEDKLKVLNSKGSSSLSATDKANEKHMAETKIVRDTVSNFNKSVSVDNILNGKLSDANVAEEVAKLATSVKDGAGRDAIVKRAVANIRRQARDSGYLDLSSESLRTGKITTEGKKILQTIKALEQGYASKIQSTGAFNKERTVVTSAKAYIGTVNDVTQIYDTMKSELDAFSNTGNIGAVNTAKKFLADMFGDMMKSKIEEGGDKVNSGASKVQTHYKGMIDTMDKITDIQERATKAGRQLTAKEQVTIKKLKNTIENEGFREINTKVYLAMKKMLQAISGMGVTNQELDAYQKHLSGTDYTSLESIMSNLTAGAKSQIGFSNIAANNMSSLGANYIGIKSVLDIRNAGSYLIDTRFEGTDLSVGLSQNIEVQPSMQQTNPKVFNLFVDSATKSLRFNKGTVKMYIGYLDEFFNGSDENKSMSDFMNAYPDIPERHRADILKLAKAWNEMEDHIARANLPEPSLEDFDNQHQGGAKGIEGK